MLRNTQSGWGSVAKSLHWLILVLVLAEVPAGFLMSYTYGLSLRDPRDGLPLHRAMGQIHHTLGLTILLLMLGRLVWRLSGMNPRVEPRGRVAALGSRAVHGALYAVLIVLPLSGWAALSVYGEAPLWLFNRSDLVPPLLAKVPLTAPHGYGFYARIHGRALWVGIGLLGLHVVAAAWHHLVRRDSVFLRMWPLALTPARSLAP